jgi:hypothetical protein|tara:strand:+ start:454 stop:633 length:180 start_codon:yes stop_codon:yes gene_type:complete
MKTLELNQMETLEGGNDAFCNGVYTAGAIYTIGAATQFWNPVGWVSIAFLAVSAACKFG